MPDEEKKVWPSWRYGPKGEAEVFQSADEVPAGWKSHPSEFKTIKADDKPAAAPAGSEAPRVVPSTGDDGSVELDADGHPWSADLHAATKAKTTAGLWRMKVGAKRPDPAEGYPKLDL